MRRHSGKVLHGKIEGSGHWSVTLNSIADLLLRQAFFQTGHLPELKWFEKLKR
jgi:hypothetical protein